MLRGLRANLSLLCTRAHIIEILRGDVPIIAGKVKVDSPGKNMAVARARSVSGVIHEPQRVTSDLQAINHYLLYAHCGPLLVKMYLGLEFRASHSAILLSV